MCKIFSLILGFLINFMKFQGGYMNAKIEKLDKQGLPLKKASDIFKGVAIFVNGYTSK